MAKETIDTGTNKVDVDLDRYTDLILKLDEAQDKIREMEKITKELTLHRRPLFIYSIFFCLPLKG